MLSSGLQVHWTFEDRVGSTVLDMSGHGRHGTVDGATFVSSSWGEAISFDGVDDRVIFSGFTDTDVFGGVDGDFTISVRAKVDDVDRYNNLCRGCGPMASLFMGTSNLGPRFYANLYDQSTGLKTWPMSSESLVDDTWVVMTMVVDGGVGTKYYLDCELDANEPEPDVGLYDYDYTRLGEGTTSGNWFDGQIDDVRVWSRKLSEAEIEDLCDEPVEAPCDGDPMATTLGITLPNPPTSTGYSPPSGIGVAVVDTVAELEYEIGIGTDTIVLEDGIYEAGDLSGDFLQLRGQKLWAQHVGGVTLEFGISAAGTNDMTHTYTGAELHGLVLDIDDAANMAAWQGPGGNWFYGSLILADDATAITVEDCVFHGHGVVEHAIVGRVTDGLEIRRVEVDGFTKGGIFADVYDGVTNTTDPILTDIRVSDVRDPLNEEAGFGIKIGDTATLTRIRVRDTNKAGITVNGSTDGSLLQYIDIDRIGFGYPVLIPDYAASGVYFDNTAKNVTLENFCIGPNTSIGVQSEWDHNNNGCVLSGSPLCDPQTQFPRGINNTVQDGLIESRWIGVNFHRGTVSGDVNNVTFRNYTRAGIVFHDNISPASIWPSYDDGSTQSSNTFEVTEVAGVVCDLSYTNPELSTYTCE